MCGRVVSATSARYIKNMLAATASCKAEEEGDSSDDTDAEDWTNAERAAGNLDLVQKTLDGIAAQSRDDGAKGFGRHAATIRLGRLLWQSPPLSPSEASIVEERLFDDGHFPAADELRKSLAALKKDCEERVAPYAGKTSAYAGYGERVYAARLQEWFNKVSV